MNAKLPTLYANELAATARLFSSSVFHEMARFGASPTFARLISQSTLYFNVDRAISVGDFLDFAFSILKKKAYRYEYAYRAAITHKLLLGVHTLKSASMLTEFRVGSCKADIVILNGTSSVYEIKSERDNLDRLPKQVDSYRKVFARVNVITSEGHLHSVLSKVPAEVGVLILSDRFQISTVREAAVALTSINPVSVYECLQRHEVIKVLERFGKRIPEAPNTRMYEALREEFSMLTASEAHDGMLNVLKKTRSLLRLSELSHSLPISLRPAALSTAIREKDHAKLLSAIRTPISEAVHWA